MWILFALLAALTSAAVITLSKSSIKDSPPSLVFAIQTVLAMTVAWGASWWQGVVPELGRLDRRAWLVIAATGVLTGTSSLLAFRALSLGDASRVSPLMSVTLVFSVALATIFLKEKLTWQVVLGAALMASGALVIAFAKPADQGGAEQKNGRPETGAAVPDQQKAA